MVLEADAGYGCWSREVRAVVPEYKYMGGKEGISRFEWCARKFNKVDQGIHVFDVV